MLKKKNKERFFGGWGQSKHPFTIVIRNVSTKDPCEEMVTIEGVAY